MAATMPGDVDGDGCWTEDDEAAFGERGVGRCRLGSVTDVCGTTKGIGFVNGPSDLVQRGFDASGDDDENGNEAVRNELLSRIK